MLGAPAGTAAALLAEESAVQKQSALACERDRAVQVASQPHAGERTDLRSVMRGCDALW